MAQSYSRDVLRCVVAQVCQTIGWHAIQTTPLELMVDFLHRNLEEICKVTHRYSEQFGQTLPNLDHLGLAFQDLGVDLTELGDYVRNVASVPCPHDVPKYPVPRESHLNFLKPGSNEVVHRPVHVHEHLPPMHPDLEDPSKQTPLLNDVPSTSGEGSSTNPSVFKRPGDPLESPALKRTRLMLEEEGRPMREISSVIMTTSGFLSPAREGKLPESRPPIIPTEIECLSPVSSSFPTVPPEIKSEKKAKKSLNKKSAVEGKKTDKENSKKKESKDGDKPEKPKKVKKLAGMKEFSKLKALKTGAKKKVTPVTSEGNPKDFTNFVENLYKATNLSKKQTNESAWMGPGSSKDTLPMEKVREPNVPEVKLSTEPDKQKLNIFKKISKVKEEKSEVSRDSRESSISLSTEEFTERSWPVSTAESEVADLDEDIYSDNLSPPGTPSTPKTPELPSKLGGKKKKKDKSKSKSKSKLLSKKAKLEQLDAEILDRPKTPEAPNVSNLFAFSSHFPAGPGLIPSPLMHPLFPNLPFPKAGDSMGSIMHPVMSNLPIPPISFMQPSTSVESAVVEEEEVMEVEAEVQVLDKDKPPEKEKKSKETKKDEKKMKKKKLKKEKVKNKEKGEKKKDEKKMKDKEKSKEKKKEKKEREREEKEKAELTVPKITFKLGPDSSRPSTPEGQTRKIVIKPVVKKDDDHVEPKRAASPELAKFSALVTRHPKQKSKSSEPSVSDVVPAAVEPAKPEPKTKESKKALVTPSVSKETVAFYHDDAGNKIWICPACKGPDDGSPMIGCDDCDAWYHWVCVNIQVPPDDKEDWYCRECILRKQESITDKKKKPRKKKV